MTDCPVIYSPIVVCRPCRMTGSAPPPVCPRSMPRPSNEAVRVRNLITSGHGAWMPAALMPGFRLAAATRQAEPCFGAVRCLRQCRRPCRDLADGHGGLAPTLRLPANGTAAHCRASYLGGESPSECPGLREALAVRPLPFILGMCWREAVNPSHAGAMARPRAWLPSVLMPSPWFCGRTAHNFLCPGCGSDRKECGEALPPVPRAARRGRGACPHEKWCRLCHHQRAGRGSLR
jgi:hypothetical protein